MIRLGPRQAIPELYPREILDDTISRKIHIALMKEYSCCLDRSFSAFDIRGRVFVIMDNKGGSSK